MWRAMLEPALLFLAPFIAYAILLVLRRNAVFLGDSWGRGTVSLLTLAGLVAAVAWFVYIGFNAERYSGAYVPAHIENGKLVPGRME
jgi:hypothetical protein